MSSVDGRRREEGAMGSVDGRRREEGAMGSVDGRRREETGVNLGSVTLPWGTGSP